MYVTRMMLGTGVMGRSTEQVRTPRDYGSTAAWCSARLGSYSFRSVLFREHCRLISGAVTLPSRPHAIRRLTFMYEHLMKLVSIAVISAFKSTSASTACPVAPVPTKQRNSNGTVYITTMGPYHQVCIYMCIGLLTSPHMYITEIYQYVHIYLYL